MDQLIPVLFVTAFIAFILIKQIKHITNNLPQEDSRSEHKKYANFSVSIQNYIRVIKNDIDSSKEKETPKFVLLDPDHEKEALEQLSDFLRKLVFFETLMARQKSSSEIEAELFSILDRIDSFIKAECQNGEELAEELREMLFSEYQNL